MDSELLKDWEKFKLTEEEEAIIGGDFEDSIDDDSDTQISLTLVGKLLTNKTFNFEAFKRTLISIWRAKDEVAIRMVESNLSVFQFFNEAAKNRVVEGSPWFFDNKLVVLKEISGNEHPSEVSFTRSPFWIHLEDVPFDRRKASVASEVGESLGGFLEYDASDPLGWEKVMRIKVLFDIEKPLRRGLRITTRPSSSKWIGIKYERLVDYCFYCVRLDHTERDCQFLNENVGTEEEVVYQYGPFLRGSPQKRIRTSDAERIREANLLKNLKEKKFTRCPSNNDTSIIKLGPPAGASKKLLFETPEKLGKGVHHRLDG